MSIVASNSAQEEALERLARRKGVKHVIIVRAVLKSKLYIEALETEIAPPLLKLVIEGYSDHIASMCSLLDVEFNTDVLPSVEHVEQELLEHTRKNLQ